MKPLLWLVVSVHLIVLIGNLAAAIWLLVYAPWYVCFPTISFLCSLVVNRWDCPLTMAENAVRRRLRLPPISGFIGHYFIKPFRKQHASTR